MSEQHRDVLDWNAAGERRFTTERAIYIDPALAPAIALGAVMTVRPMAPIISKHEVDASLAREVYKTPNENSHLLSGLFSIVCCGGGGGSRTRVRKYAVAGIYMRSRT